jgi:tetratricopeptide (TPR) repeat protein
MYLFLVEAEMNEKEPEKAMATLQKGFKELKDPYFLWIQTDWSIDKGDLKDVEKSIEEITKRNFDDRGVAYLRGKMAFQKGKWLEAKTKFNQALPFFNDQPDKQKVIHYLIGQCHGRLGNPDQQILADERALSIDPNYEPALIDRSAKKQQQNQIVLPLPQILSLLKTNKDPNTLANLLSMAIATKSQKPPEEQNWKELEDILDGIEKDMPDMVQLPLFRCEIMIAQKRYEEVEKSLRGLLEKNPKSRDYWRAMTIVGLNQNKLDQVETTLADFEKALGDTLDLRLMKANYFLRRYGKDAKDHLAKLSENADAFDDREKNALWQTILGAMRQIGARDEVRRLTELMAERDPNNIQFLLMSFDQAVEVGDEARMAKLSDDIERVEGRGAYWYYSQAYIRIFKVRGGGDPSLLDEALTDLDKAESKRGSWSKIPLLRGRVFDQKKDILNALKYYQDAISMGDYNTYAVMRVIQLLAQQNKVREANEFIRRLDNEKIALAPELTQYWISLMLNKEIRDYETALAKARKVLEAKPDDAKVAIWFGETLGNLDRLTSGMANRKKDFEGLAPEVEKSFRHAVKLAPENSDAWVKLTLFLISSNRLSEAEKTLEEARKHFVGVEGQLALGQCLMAMRHFEPAKEQFEQALAADPKNAKIIRVLAGFYVLKSVSPAADKADDLKQAESLMHRIIEDKGLKVEKEDLFWARRSLAWIVLSREGYENVELARNLVAQNLKDDSESAPDLSLMASINSRDPKQSNRDLAIRAIRDLQADQKATSEDLYRLAELYLSKGDWPAASELFRGLAVGAIDDPMYVSRYIRELLDHAEVGDAEVFLRQMREKWPNDIRTILLQAELLARSEKAETALDSLKGFVDNPQAIPADRGQRMRLMALSLEDFCNRVLDIEQAADAKKYLQTAELYFKQYASDHPSASMELANFYSRQNRPDDAVDVIEQHWQGLPPKSLYESSMLATDSGRSPKEIADRVISILGQARERFKDDPAIPLALAGIKLGQGDYQEAEDIYHDILKKYPEHPVTLNNLTVMLTVSRKNLPEALEMIQKAIRITGPIPQMLDTRACVYIAMKEPEKALADMKDVLAAGKKPETLFHYAQALEIAGQSNAAASTMQEALQMGLTEKSLMTSEIPTFKRLQEKANKLNPPKKQDKKSPKK